MLTYRLPDESLEIIGLLEEQFPFPEDALAVYWRFLGAQIGFDPSTVETRPYYEFVAEPADVATVETWRDPRMGGNLEATFARLPEGELLCWCSDGTFGVYESQAAFAAGEALATIMLPERTS